MGRLWTGRVPHLASAYISGISVGILIRTTDLWPYVLCSMISIASKYALRFRGRHLWNPTNFGVSVLLLLTPIGVLSFQWDSEIWPVIIIWSLGSLILYRLRLLHITLTYAVAFVVLAGVRSALTGERWVTELAPITGPMYQLFMFFMITDPKTITRAKWSQCLVVVLVAVVETILRLNQVIYAPFYALFIVGPLANVIEILWNSRKASRPAAVAPAAADANGTAPAPVPSVPAAATLAHEIPASPSSTG
jgi:Na+-transporting NADH:ubiquinone oxidoreductase subunit NqrB